MHNHFPSTVTPGHLFVVVNACLYPLVQDTLTVQRLTVMDDNAEIHGEYCLLPEPLGTVSI